MNKKVLITGGAGFIGSHLSERLLAEGCSVRVLDSLEPQVHGTQAGRAPSEGAMRGASGSEGGAGALPPEVRASVDFRRADLRDRTQVESAVQGMDAVVHLAAAVGVGQSMYEIARYTSMNAGATAVLAEALIAHPVEQLVVASSMSVYGEGLYQTASGMRRDGVRRRAEDLAARQWDPRDERGEPLVPLRTPERKRVDLSSVYALTKFHQEQQLLILGRAYDMQATALRLFNVYGPRQSLSNPYTGVLAIFASRLLARKAPVLFEDGHQRRDFVHVDDVVEAFRRTLEQPVPDRVLNVGSGEQQSVLDVATTLREVLGVEEVPLEISGTYRVGDVRHCYADIALARALLGWTPRVRFAEGVRRMVDWLADSGTRGVDRVDAMRSELVARGLAR